MIDDLNSVSKITDNIYLSGVNPLNNPLAIFKLNITYILCCVDKQYVADLHKVLCNLFNNKSLIILYLPLYDSLTQNLWDEPENKIDISFSTISNQNHLRKTDFQNLYKNKPLIEIGYHFIDNVVSNSQNILIHCMAGISRSVSLLSYYFMKKHSTNLKSVLNFIKTKRKIAKPNNFFLEQLQMYEKKRETFNGRSDFSFQKKIQYNS